MGCANASNEKSPKLPEATMTAINPRIIDEDQRGINFTHSSIGYRGTNSVNGTEYETPKELSLPRVMSSIVGSTAVPDVASFH